MQVDVKAVCGRTLLHTAKAVCVAVAVDLAVLCLGLLFNDILFKEAVRLLVPVLCVAPLLGLVSVGLQGSSLAIFTIIEVCLFFQAYRILQQTLSDLIAFSTSVQFKHFALLVLLPEVLKLLPVAKCFALNQHDPKKLRVAISVVAIASSLAFAAMASLSLKTFTGPPLCHVVSGVLTVAVVFQAKSGIMLLPSLVLTTVFMSVTSLNWATVLLSVLCCLAGLAAICVQAMNMWASEVALAVRERRLSSSMSHLSKLRFHVSETAPVSDASVTSTAPSFSV